MELSLNGSQINLATRQKPNTPAVNYPSPIDRHIQAERPGSAIVINSNKIYKEINASRRPISADNYNYSKKNVRKTQSNFELSINKKLSKFNKRFVEKNTNLGPSSAEVLKTLLSDPIRRSWRAADIKDLKFHNKRNNRKKEYYQMDSDNESTSSITEDIQHTACDGNTGLSDENPPEKIDTNKYLSPTLNESETKKIVTKYIGGPRKYVSFDYEGPISQDVNISKENLESKPDLPGRVSFSKNNVYEVDFSDCDSNEQLDNTTDLVNSQNLKKSVHFQESPVNQVKSSSSYDTSDKYCCSSKCNTFGEDRSLFEEPFSTKQFEENDESSKIIADYKKEIQSLNQYRKALPDNSFVNSKEESDINNIKSFKSDFFKQTKSLSPSSNNNEDKFLSDQTDKKLLREIKVFKELDKVKKSSSNEAINNYLKVTISEDFDTINKSIISNSPLVKGATTNTSKSTEKTKPIGITSKRRILRGKLTKTVDPNITLNKKSSELNEFHIDKVESWMSVNEKKISNIDKVRKPAENNETSSCTYDVTWRETPSTLSKTDDEGNYSFEEHFDSASNDGSTYEEIVSVIKEIDEQKENDVINDFHQTKNSKTFSLTLNIDQLSSARSNDSSNKIKDILTYLDDVDNNCDKTIQNSRLPDSYRSDIEFAVEPDIVGDVPKMVDLVMLPNHQLGRRIIALTLRSNELSNAIQLAKEHMGLVRQEKLKGIRMEKQNTQSRLKEQKAHYESIVSRHQGFIEQLLRDKSQLCEKVTAMTRRLDSQNQAWEHKLETEIGRVKETTIAAEKIRRERWVRENTKKIKELTVKGLEQELNGMTCNHQKEITELKCQHQQELLNVAEEARLKYESMEASIRDNYTQDREMAIEKERNAIRERFQRQIEMEQKSFEEQKSRLIADFAAERDRLHFDIRQKEQEFVHKRNQMIDEKNETVAQLRLEFREKFKNQEQKAEAEISSMRDKYESDMMINIREQETTYKIREVEKENLIRQQCRVERDRQIDAIIAKMDVESTKAQQDFDMKINRLKEKHENEIKEHELREQKHRDQYSQILSKLAETEAAVENMKSTQRQLEIQLSHSKRMCNDLTEEKENFKETARKEIQVEVITLKRERDDEIQKIHSRVQKAIEKKDASIEVIRNENIALKERCLKLEAIIRQQRKDYCTK